MAPPDYRRIGVDASIVQADTVRGYDSPNVGEPAGDLLITTGRNSVTTVVSQIILWNRTDDPAKPVFVLTAGSNLATSPKVQVYSGALADPNAAVVGTIGSFYISTANPPSFWQCQGGTAWKKISDDLGGESLSETLAIGNTTDGFNIVVSSTDSIRGADNALGVGGPLNLVGGSSSFLGGTGGLVRIQGGSASSGPTGAVQIATATASVAANSGNISVTTGDSLLGGSAGSLTFQGGRAGAPNIVGAGGTVNLTGGESLTTGATPARGGSLVLRSGKAQPAGEGGSVWLWAGDSAVGGVVPFILPPVAGQGGAISLRAGNSSNNLTGGSVSVNAGAGGSGGGTGGSIFLNPGVGGGGGAQGEVVASGVMRSTNLKRGNGNPNTIGETGTEGTIFQRTSGGLGELWVNTNGTQTGWERLAFAGDFIQVFTKIQHGQITPVLDKLGVNLEDGFSDTGIYEGITAFSNFVAGFAPDITVNPTAFGPVCTFRPNGTGNDIAIQVSANTTGLQIQQRFLAVFKISNTSNSNSWRGVIGLSSGSASNALSSDSPAGQHIFLQKASGSNNWRLFTSGFGGPNPTSLNAAAGNLTSSLNVPRYVVIDAMEYAIQLRISILDENFEVLDEKVISDPNLYPQATTILYPVVAVRQTGASATNLLFWFANVVVEADKLLSAAAASTPDPTLEQVLLAGNTTGVTPIEISEGSLIRAETDGGGGAGSALTLISGGTLIAANNTGSVFLGSSPHGVAAGTGITGAVLIQSGGQLGNNSTGSSGALVLSTGNLGAATIGGQSGSATLTTGEVAGSGPSSGSVFIRTGEHTGGGAVGSVFIQPGGPVPISATPGNITFQPAQTTLNGVTGGSIQGTSGAAGNIGNTGAVSFTTSNADVQGDAGSIFLTGGRGGSTDGRGGSITITGGDGVGAGATSFGGALNLVGGAGVQSGGDITLTAGNSDTLQGASVTIRAGDQTGAGQGGHVFLIPGSGGGSDGEVIVQGKLTVTGLIDPTGLVLDGQAVVPFVPPVGQGVIWVENGGDTLKYTTSGGTIDLGSGGATTLASLTDVNIAGPVLGEVLTYNGVQWQNLPGMGGSPLSTVLALGNVTGANDIEVNTGQDIHGQTDLNLNPGGGALDRVVIHGLRWPSADGNPGDVLTTDGFGNLSFAPGGGGSGSFAAAFAQMQWGSLTPPPDNAKVGNLNGSGILHDTNDTAPGGGSIVVDSSGMYSEQVCVATIAEAGFISVNLPTQIDARPYYLVKFRVSGTTNVRVFCGLTTGTRNDMATSDAPGSAIGGYLGIGFSTALAETDWMWIHNSGAGLGTRTSTTIPASTSVFYAAFDGSVPGQITATLYDAGFTALSQTIINANLPLGTTSLNVVSVLFSIVAPSLALSTYQVSLINRADLLNGLGGGGTQNLAQVLAQGNETGGTQIQGDDNAGGDGVALLLKGGSSTGGGGSGAGARLSGGDPDPGGNGDGGIIRISAAAGAGSGLGGGVFVEAGDGGAGGGDAGSVLIFAGDGGGLGMGGNLELSAGDGGAAGGSPGGMIVTLGAALAGNVAGGTGTFTAGAGAGIGAGGSWTISAGAGGLAGGNGGNITLTPGAGNGGGVDGSVSVLGDLNITGKLTVVGMIDPPGLLMSSSVAAPATPAGTEGLLWVSNTGDLIYTTTGGDLNISQGVGGGIGFLDALLIAGYGFLSPGNGLAQPTSSGVLGDSAYASTVAGATLTYTGDNGGPVLLLSTAAAPTSEASIGTGDLVIRRDQRFKAVIKFQITSPVHTDERIFIGVTNDAALQLSADDPLALNYFGLREDLAGFNLNFVSRGPVSSQSTFAIPTDGFVHYLVIDCTAPTNVTYRLLASDGVTVEAEYTESDANVLPVITERMQLFAGVRTDTGAVRDMDFYFASLVTRADIVDSVAGGGGTITPQGLPSVLIVDNQTGGTPIKGSDDVVGGALELYGGDSTGGGGDGGAVLIAGGNPDAGGTSGSVQISTPTGDAAGAISLSVGASSATPGSALNLIAGSATGVGQPGGDLSITGGQSSTSLGGSVFIRSGSSLSGNAGQVRIIGTAGTNNGTGGRVSLIGGAGDGTGSGGNILLTSGAAGAGSTTDGAIGISTGTSLLPAALNGNIQGATSNDPNANGSTFIFDRGTAAGGGSITLTAGSAVGGVTPGGNVEISSGDSSGGLDEGTVYLLGPGVSPPFGAPGGVVLQAKGDALGGAGGGAFFTKSFAGIGGSVSLEGGDADPGTAAQGGPVFISGGDGDGVGDGGGVFVQGGNSAGPAGDCLITGGNTSSAGEDAGAVSVVGGTGISTSLGGNATLSGGNIGAAPSIVVPNTNGRGGHVFVLGGASASSAPGGSVYIFAGQSGPSAATSGSISMVAGPGIAGSNAAGGTTYISGGSGGSGGAPGGAVTIAGGNGAGGGINSGGDVVLQPGAGTISAANGRIFLNGRMAPNASGMQFGTYTLAGASAGPFVITFPAAFPVAPRTITISLEEAIVTSTAIKIVGGSITTTQFQVRASAVLAVGSVIHWTALRSG